MLAENGAERAESQVSGSQETGGAGVHRNGPNGADSGLNQALISAPA